MFHNIAYKFTKVDSLGCGQVAIKKNHLDAQTETNAFFLGLVTGNDY